MIIFYEENAVIPEILPRSFPVSERFSIVLRSMRASMSSPDFFSQKHNFYAKSTSIIYVFFETQERICTRWGAPQKIGARPEWFKLALSCG